MALYVNAGNCIGCRLCQLACSAKKEGVFNPELARLKVTSHYTKSGMEIKSSICNLCLTCVDVCPTSAITFQDGHLAYNKDDCTLCGVCSAECPEQVIRMLDDKAAICDLCEGAPACTEWCPQEAITDRGGQVG